MIQTFSWLTDIHINFLDTQERQQFYTQILSDHSEAIVITGDIAEAHDVGLLLTEMAEFCQKPIYFVLGNHDYYRGSVTSVRENIIELCDQNPYLIYLSQKGVIPLNDTTALIGQDGWADARYGDFHHSTVSLNDSHLIAELYQAKLLGNTELRSAMQRLADADANDMQRCLDQAISKYKQIYIATHVPPVEEACWHLDSPSEPDWLPYFSSKVMGEVIVGTAEKYPDIKFHVLCGHTHTAKEVEYLPNLLVSAGHAEYYHPKVQKVFMLSDALQLRNV